LFVHQQQITHKDFDTTKALLLDKKSRATQGEDVFQDTKLDHWEVEANITKVKKDLVDLGKQ